MRKDVQKPAFDAPLFPMRINKYLAFKKHSTRRGADELIKKKLVFINNKLAVLGDKVKEADNVEIKFRGKPTPLFYFAYNKPKGAITESMEQDGNEKVKGKNQTTAFKGIFPIGGLDKDSHGLVIQTSDGRITERLLSSAYGDEKEYIVTTRNALRTSFKEKMETGVKIEKEQAGACKVHILNANTFRVILTEEKKHQIRRMCSALFQEVEDVKRVRILNISLGDMAEGAHRKIDGEELKTFLQTLGIA